MGTSWFLLSLLAVTSCRKFREGHVGEGEEQIPSEPEPERRSGDLKHLREVFDEDIENGIRNHAIACVQLAELVVIVTDDFARTHGHVTGGVNTSRCSSGVEQPSSVSYIVTASSPRNLGEMSRCVSHLKRGKLFLVFNRYQTQSEMSETQRILVRWRVLDVTVVNPADEVQEVHGVRFTSSGRKCAERLSLARLGTCARGEFHGNELHEHAAGCSVDVVAVTCPPFVIDHLSGFEINLVREITGTMDISVDVTARSAAWGVKDQVVGWNGTLRELVDGWGVGVGNVHPDVDVYEDFQPTRGYFHEHLVWVLPRTKRCSACSWSWSPTFSTLWFINVAVFAISAVSFYALTRATIPERISYSFLVSLQIFLGVSLHHKPETKLTRIVFMSLVTYAVLTSTLYQGFPVDSPHHGELTNEHELLESGIQLGGLDSYQGIINNTAYHVATPQDNNARYWIQRVCEDGDVATVMGESCIRYLVDADHAVARNVHVLHKPLVSYPVEMVTSRGHFLWSRLDKRIGEFNEFGLSLHWVGRYASKARGRLGKSSKPVVGLGLEHVRGAFVVLLAGLGFGSAAFVCEICFGKFT